MIKMETRTVSVRIELPNPDGKIKTGMYADVVFRVGDGEAPALAVPDSAIIDSGTRQVVLVAKGEGRFEPREVNIGRRGEGHTEIVSGLQPGEEIVTSATFLIDAESNLRAALQAFSQGEPK
jgi:Cu(I)/Ag(I) efflux system membrane fusion protein